jgi:hypothetical protein
MPGALTSTPIMPVFTSTRSHSSTPGNASGVPLPSGSVMLMSPTRNRVCVHELPCAPMCAGELGYIAAAFDAIRDHFGIDGFEQGVQRAARRHVHEHPRRRGRLDHHGPRRFDRGLRREHGRLGIRRRSPTRATTAHTPRDELDATVRRASGRRLAGLQFQDVDAGACEVLLELAPACRSAAGTCRNASARPASRRATCAAIAAVSGPS